MTRDLGRVGRGLTGRSAGRWGLGAGACLLLAIASPASSQSRAVTPSSYAECLRAYSARTDAAAYCRRLFPAQAPSQVTPSRAAGTYVRQTPNIQGTTPGATTTPSTTPDPPSSSTGSQTPPPTRVPPSRTPEREPIDITPQLNQLIEGLASRQRTPKPPAKLPADPLAVIPGILADCAAYTGNAQRWRRCTADGWRGAGLRGQPPLVLQTPPTPPPVYEPPPVYQPPVQSEPSPPVQSRPPPVTPKPPAKPPVKPVPKPPPPVVAQPEPPVAVVPPLETPPPVAPPPLSPQPPPVVFAPAPPPAVPPQPKPPSIPIWAWLVALAVAAGGGFGVAKLVGRARSVPSRTPGPEAAPCAPPEIALVVDPGVVVLTPDGSPRAGLAVSLRFDRAADADEIRLDYPSLETAP